MATSSLHLLDGVPSMPPPSDLSRSLVRPGPKDQNSTIIAVVELSHSSWLVGGVLPGVERQPRRKQEPSPERLVVLLHRWQDEAVRAGSTITRIALAFEAGRDGFWLARWLEARGGRGARDPSRECGCIAGASPGQDRPAGTELLKRGFLVWLRGERAIAAIGAPQRSHAVDGGGRTVARSRHRLRVDQLAGPRAAFPVLAPAAGVAFAFAVKLPGEGEGSGMACRPAVSNALTARHLVLHSGHNGHGARTDDCRRGRQAAEPPRAATPAASAAYDGK